MTDPVSLPPTTSADPQTEPAHRRWRVSMLWLLTVPFVLLMVALALALGALAYRSGSGAVNVVATQLVQDVVKRLGQAVEHHVMPAGRVLDAAYPPGTVAAADVRQDEAALRQRLWLATAFQPDPYHYVYYANQDGQSLGMMRRTPTQVEWRSKYEAKAARQIALMAGLDDVPTSAVTEDKVFEPRQRPWYRAAMQRKGDVWTPFYVDFRSRQLVATRARPVADAQGRWHGVVATDMAMGELDRFIAGLRISPGGFAFIVEPDGQLVATSRGTSVRMVDGEGKRVQVDAVQTPLLAKVYEQVRASLPSTSLEHPGSLRIADAGGQVYETGFARISDDAGLDWGIVVAMPREDYLGGIATIVERSAIGAGVTALVMLLLGMLVVRGITSDVRRLAHMAQRIGTGDWNAPLLHQRTRELWTLAQSLARMQDSLRTDRLTGLANREALLQRMEQRMKSRRRGELGRNLAVLFVDLDGFKSVNDRFGHHVGDRVLTDMGQRLAASVRAQDMVARWAGDEFVVLLDPIAGAADAHQVRAQVEARLREPMTLEGGEQLTVRGGSVGLAVYPDDAATALELIQAADVDMYRRKRGG
ncbi:MAG: diguanylate cyclase [Proteobacteria bacterium]|nr:diguanylate cyclase [Pseudomonadota bacterium]